MDGPHEHERASFLSGYTGGAAAMMALMMVCCLGILLLAAVVPALGWPLGLVVGVAGGGVLLVVHFKFMHGRGH